MVKIKVYNPATGEVSEEDFMPPTPPDPTPYQIAKTTPWVCMTRAEAAIMDTVMSETDA
ncbi:hypothetical protein [Agrobacterium rosae]|uniref:hypothetical protein n=1 Tax=Agrobacterium rosae TaxID=1972867 RepID=UPI00203433E3|nr:hypothetical protein [Agrobacterium rosae]MCM2436320.1 hypothetical protein [Agrobacterium rosae]